MSNARNIVIVDCDESSCRALRTLLVKEGFYASCFKKIDEVKPELGLLKPSLLLLDIEGEGGRGFEFLAFLREAHPALPVIILTACRRPDVIVAAMKLGAEDYIQKPYDPIELIFSLRNVLGWDMAESLSPEGDETASTVTRLIIGPSEMMLNLKAILERVSDTDINVLITGESGTGKELAARMLYAGSPRKEKIFMKVNCASLPYKLLESELFGYEKGAFTGARQQKPGKFELANHGTLYLDEIAELHPALQAKLLQVLQDGKFARLGGREDIEVDVRVMASTNRNLKEEVSRKRFREDLFFRLNVLGVHIPPLRERKEEIPFLAEIFVEKFCAEFNKTPKALFKKTLKTFQKYDWPGNIRELENILKRIVLFGNEATVRQELSRKRMPLEEPEDPGESFEVCRPGYFLKEVSRKAAMEAEREAILDALRRSQWNRRKAAEMLAVSYKAFLYKMKQMDLNP